MTLKAVYESQDDIPESFRSLFSEGEDGKYHLTKIEGLTTKEKEKQFRENNTELKKQIASYEEKLRTFADIDPERLKLLKDIDPEKYQELLEKERQIEEGELIKKNDIDGLVALRLKPAQEKYEKRIKELEKAHGGKDNEIDELKVALAKSMIESRVTKSVNMVGKVREGALFDIIRRAEEIFKPIKGDNGYDIQAQHPDGSMMSSPEDVTKGFSVEDFAKSLPEKAPYFFEGSAGSGSQGDGGKPGTNFISADGVRSGKDIDDIASGKKKVQR